MRRPGIWPQPESTGAPQTGAAAAYMLCPDMRGAMTVWPWDALDAVLAKGEANTEQYPRWFVGYLQLCCSAGCWFKIVDSIHIVLIVDCR